MHIEIFIASANHRQKASGYGYVIRHPQYPAQPVIGFGPASKGFLPLSEGELIALEKAIMSLTSFRWLEPSLVVRSCNPRFLQSPVECQAVLTRLKIPLDSVTFAAVNGMWEYYNAAEAAARVGAYDAYLQFHALAQELADGKK
jgi:hypothetical protein